jgi:LPS-assembly protein
LRREICIAGFLVLVLASATGAQSPVTVEADRLEYQATGNVFEATGGVVVEWDENRLEAEKVLVEQDERRVEATGGVELDSPAVSLTADTCFLSVDDETGRLTEVVVRPKNRSGRFGGAEIEKLEGQHYRIKNGFYTTCDLREGGSPDWEISGDELDIELDGYGSLSGGALRVLGRPVMYLPRAVFPTKTNRQSGLLRPHIGSSSRRGFVISQPYFWAIDKAQDLTISGEVQTSARLGLTAEYRARPSKNTWTRVSGSYFNEQIRGESEREIDTPALEGKSVGENRGFFDLETRHRFENRPLIFHADVLATTDDLYLREIDSLDSGDVARNYRRALRYGRSQAGLLGWSDTTSYGVDARGYQNFYDDDDAVLQRPLTAWARKDTSFGRVAVDLDGEVAAFTRADGPDGQRARTAVRGELPLAAGRFGKISAWTRARATAYRLDERNVLDDDGKVERRLDESSTRGMLEAGIEARTKLARDFSFEDGRTLRHTVEPFVGYGWASDSDSDSDDFPLFDRFDSFDGRDVIHAGMDSSFLVRDAAGVRREVARIAMLAGYNTSDDVTSNGFTDVDLAAFLRPNDNWALRTLTSINPTTGDLSGAHASVFWEPGAIGPLVGQGNRVGVAYRFVRGGIVESAEGRTRFAFNDRFSVGLRGRYEFESERFVEKGGSFRITSACNCWSIDLGILSRVNPDELQMRILVELAGIGGMGESAVGRGVSPALDDIAYEDLGFWRAGW